MEKNQFPKVIFTYKGKVATIPIVYDLSDESKTPIPLSDPDWSQACYDWLYYTFDDAEMLELQNMPNEEYKKCMEFVYPAYV